MTDTVNTCAVNAERKVDIEYAFMMTMSNKEQHDVVFGDGDPPIFINYRSSATIERAPPQSSAAHRAPTGCPHSVNFENAGGGGDAAGAIISMLPLSCTFSQPVK